MGAVRKQEVPQLQHLGQRRGTGAHGQDRGERVQLRLHVLRLQVARELGVDNGQALFHQRQAFVHPVHRPPDVPGALLRNEPVEGDKRFGLTPGSVEERSTQDVHALDIDTWFRPTRFGSVGRCRCRRALGVLDDGRSVLQFRAPPFVGRIHQGRLGKLFNLGIMELPRYRIEETDQGGFTDSTLEEGVGSKRSESVVSDLGISWRRSTADKLEIAIG